jgi:signal transduction histidine kinase
MKKILVVEDDIGTSLFITELLKSYNFEIEIRANGREAVDFIRNGNKADLILMDVQMPELNGIDASKIILQDLKVVIPIIIMTVQTDEDFIKEIFDVGVVDYISKPFKRKEFIARIESAIKDKEEKEVLKKDIEIIGQKTDFLKKQTDDLKHLDEVKDNFIAYLTHDFKIPITSIKAYTDMLINNNELTNPKKKEILRVILKQANNLGEMVSELQNSFKRIASAMELKRAPADLKKLCDDIFSCFKAQAADKNIDYNLYINTGIKTIYCDAFKINELISNLLSNAFKFTDKGSITFNVYENDNYLCFKISDTGIGLDESNLEEIFNKFYRVEDIKKIKEGSGLGLFIAKKIALAHNGDIFVESSIGNGTKFTFVVPKDISC